MKKIIYVISVACILFGMVTLVLFGINTDRLDVVHYDYASSQVPASFDGYKIAQLTDIHNHSMEYSNTNLLTEINNADADVVLITGDSIDWHTKNLDSQKDLFSGLSNSGIPAYFVNGNHDPKTRYASQYKDLMEEYGIIDLDSALATVSIGSEHINFLGVDDTDLEQRFIWGWRNTGVTKDKIEALTSGMDDNELNILLSHRPSLYKDYISAKMDLVFSGHYHGGQIRLFGFGFPDLIYSWYDEGMTEIDGTTFVESHGLGYSVAPIRLDCNAQLVIVTLRTA